MKVSKTTNQIKTITHTKLIEYDGEIVEVNVCKSGIANGLFRDKNIHTFTAYKGQKNEM